MTTPPRTAHLSARYIAIISLILFAFAIRIWRLDAQPLSGDEAFSVMYWGRVSLQYLLDTIALIDPQPPVALLSFYGWVRLAGDSEFAARMLSAFSSTITTAAAYAISRRFLPPRGSLLACLLTAANPYQIWFAQDLRSYSLWMALSAMTLLCLLQVLRHPDDRIRWVAYSLSAAASIYTFYLELFLLAAHNLFVLWYHHRSRKLLLKWAISQIMIALLLAPWLLRPELRRSGYQPTGGPPDLPGALVSLLFGRTFPAQPHFLSISLPTLVALLLIAICGVIVWRAQPRFAAFVTVHALLPLLLLSALAIITQRGYFNPRYTSASSLPLILLAAGGLYSMPSAATRRGLRLVPVLGLAAGAIFTLLVTRSLAHYYFDGAYAKAPPWREVMAILNTQPGPGDIIIRNFPDPAFDYYYQGVAPAITLPAEENAPADRTYESLESLAEQYDYLWFLPVSSAAFDRERSVAVWLDGNMQLISDQWIGATRILQYTSWDRLPTSYTRLPPTSFGDIVELVGYRVTPPVSQWSAGSTIYLELFWKPLRAANQPLTMFIHLLGPTRPDGSPLWAQDDHPPQYGRLSAESWDSSTPFRDVYHIVLPLDALPGDYIISAGLYDAAGERLVLDHSMPQPEANAPAVLTFTLP